MESTHRNIFAVLLGVSVTVTWGCTSETYKIETRIGSDGAIDRAICQPVSTVPDAISKHTAWQQTRVVAKPTRETPIRQMPRLVLDKDQPQQANGPMEEHFAGWGRFACVGEIPDHFVLSASGLDRQGRLVREYRRRDLGLVVEHVWVETLTDVVELDDRRHARDELVRLSVDLAIATLEHRFGTKYRFGSLEKWCRTTAAAFVADLLDFDLQLALRGRAISEEEIQHRMIVLLDRYGLKLADSGGRLLKTFSKTTNERFVIPFARRLLKQKVVDGAGQSLSEEAIEEILVWLEIVTPEQSDEPEAEDDAGDVVDAEAVKRTRLQQSWESVITKRFGSVEAYDSGRDLLLTRIWGVYRIPYPVAIFGTARQFDVTLSLPGAVVETNGTITDVGEVVWRFDSGQAFPTGYAMSCRSLEARDGADVMLGGLQPKDRRKAMLRMVGMIASDDDPLLSVLRRSAAKTSWSPLEVYRRSLDPKKQADEVKRLDGLYRLLQLPLSGSGSAGT
jgi:hypothetical protein